MKSSLYLADSIFQPLRGKNQLFRAASEFAFLRTGSFIFGNLNQSAEILSSHLQRGIIDYSHINFKQPFANSRDKSLALVEIINKLIQSKQFKSVALLMSGGKDSALLAKLLSLNGVEVIAYHVTRHEKSHYGTKTKMKNLYEICEKAGVSKLNVVYGGASPDNLLKSFNYEFFSSPAAAGCANIFLNTDIKNHKIISFAQGADTLSNVVHTQLPYYNNLDLASANKIRKLIREMYVSTFPTKYRFLAYSIVNKIIYICKDEINMLINEELQNISRLIGMYLAHTPTDSNYIYKMAKLNAITVFNPFHTAEVEELYMTGVTNIIKTDKFEKIEIEIALKELGLEGLSFNPAGFTVNRVSDQGGLISKKQFNKQILSLINSTYTK